MTTAKKKRRLLDDFTLIRCLHCQAANYVKTKKIKLGAQSLCCRSCRWDILYTVRVEGDSKVFTVNSTVYELPAELTFAPDDETDEFA